MSLKDPVLVDRQGVSRPARGRGLGWEDHRPSVPRPAIRISRRRQPRRLEYMRALAATWPEKSIVQQLIAQLPWGHTIRVLDRIKDRPTRECYLRAALEYGGRQSVLVLQISSRLHEREPGRRMSATRYGEAHWRLHLPGNARVPQPGAGRAADGRGFAGRRHQAAVF